MSFDELVITGGSVEALQIDTCTGHVSSESVEQHVGCSNVFKPRCPKTCECVSRSCVFVPPPDDVVGVAVVPGVTADDKIYSRALLWFQTERTLVVGDQR